MMRLLVGILCVFSLVLSAWAASTAPVAPAQTPAILFLGIEPQIDPLYAKELREAGYAYLAQDIYQPLTYDFLKRFTVIVLDQFPWYGSEYQVLGQKTRFFYANMRRVWQFAADGGGVLVYTNLTDGGGARARQWNAQMRPWDIQLVQACLRDPATAFGKFTVYGPNYYCWTEAITPHPATAGVKRVYYPSVNARFDDNYTAVPLLCGKAWTPLVQGMPTSHVVVEVDRKEIELPEHQQDRTLVAVRAVGTGRLAAYSMNPAYAHQLGYTLNGRNSEANYGVLDGVILRKGQPGTPSDTGTLLMNLYQWLGAPALACGFGGYRQGDPAVLEPVAPSPDATTFTPIFDPEGDVPMPPSWRHCVEVVKREDVPFGVQVPDPIITGPLVMYKGLIGIHSAASDGEGSVRAYKDAARKAGYRLIFFTENFARLTPERYAKLVADCRRETTPDFACVPGYDIQDRTGNHLIIAGAEMLPRPQWLTEDGTRLVQTAYPNWMFGGVTIIAHRPLHGTVPYERLKHFQALTVFTYRGGTLVEDAVPAYDWQQQSSSNPHPVAVHEVFSPREVASARAGYQQIFPSDTPAHAAGYFCAGMWTYFDGPARTLLSEGPEVYQFTPNNKDAFPERFNRRQWRIAVGVRSAVPLREVCLVDAGIILRRWLPNTRDFHATVDLRHTNQQAIYLTARDANGRKVLTAGMRTIPPRLIFRCPDRQNWLGDVGFHYTGTYLPPNKGLTDLILPIKGTAEGSSLFPEVSGCNMAVKLDFPFIGPHVVLTQARVNEKYISALFGSGPERIGFDGTPSQASEPSTVYDARVRCYNFTPGTGATDTVSLMEVILTLKRDVEPADPAGLFPAFGAVPGNTYWWQQEGKTVTGTIDPRQALDIPVGGMAGGIVALTPGLRVQNGKFGLAPPAGQPTSVPKGTTFTARYLIRTGLSSYRTKPADFVPDSITWMRNLGLVGDTPYRLALSRGALTGVTYYATCRTENHGIAGQVATPATLPFFVPLCLPGVNGRWPAGLWRADGGIEYTGVFENTAWPLLNTAQPGAFYAGNLLTATNDQLVLELVKWTKDGILVEAHNPTDVPIEATVSTPAEITGYYPFTRKVTVPAGTSVLMHDGSTQIRMPTATSQQ